MTGATALDRSVAVPGPAWRLRLFGRPALVEAETQREVGLRPKDAALLAVVALAGPIEAAHLAAWLWPAASARQADTSLRQRLFRLRRDSGATLVTTGALLGLAARRRHRPRRDARRHSRRRACGPRRTARRPAVRRPARARQLAARRARGSGASGATRRSPPPPPLARASARWPADWSMRSAWSRASRWPSMRAPRDAAALPARRPRRRDRGVRATSSSA